MMFLRAFLFLAFAGIPSLTLAASTPQSIKDCAGALQPTIENTKKDYRAIQSYVQENAILLYDEWSKSSQDQREASASYKVFSAEYHDSKSSSEFQQKVTQRNQREQSYSDTAESHALSRQFLSDRQLEAWTDCIKTVSHRIPTIQLTPHQFTKNSFTLRVDIIMGTGQSETNLTLQSYNAYMTPIGSKQPRDIIKERIKKGDLVTRTYLIRLNPNATEEIRVYGKIENNNVLDHDDAILVTNNMTYPDVPADYMAPKWSDARAHINYVLQANHMRRDYYLSLLEKNGRYASLLQVHRPSPDAVNAITAYGESRTELFLADKVASDPRRVSCYSQELLPGVQHIQYAQSNPAGISAYTQARKTGKTTLEAAKEAQTHNPDALAWTEIMENLGCFAKLTKGWP